MGSWPWKVVFLRSELGIAEDPAAVQLDSYGIKVLFNHGIRRFLTGAKNREPKIKIQGGIFVSFESL